MAKIRVLVVDDSVVIRRIVAEVISTDPSCEVVGTAANGKIALAKITQVNPDIVTLDVEMPEMDGLETLQELRKTHKTLPVIMFSALTERAASSTLRALTLGATDYVTKPSGGAPAEAVQRVKDDLLPKIHAFAATSTKFSTEPKKAVVAAPRSVSSIEVLAIGCSTGGPNALATVFAKLPPKLPVPILITQHMPPLFTRLLADRLRANSPVCVREARGGEEVLPGDAWIAPGDHHMVLVRDGNKLRIALNQAPQENSCRPAVDVMFRSIAEHYGGNTLGVVLTGMGQDGFRGCELIREAGGQIVVQDEASSVVWGMPGFIARAGLADAIVPLDDVDLEIARRVLRGRRQLASPWTARPVKGSHVVR